MKRLPVTVEGDGLSLEVIKKAEKEVNWIVRVIETNGSHSYGKLLFDMDNIQVFECDLMENSLDKLIMNNNSVILKMKPFEIKTFKI